MNIASLCATLVPCRRGILSSAFTWNKPALWTVALIVCRTWALGAPPSANATDVPARAAADFGAVGIFASETNFPSRLFRVNADTGAANAIASTGFFPGLDFRNNGVLYGASTTLNTVSTNTGAITPIGVLPELIISIAFSPTGELYGVNNESRILYKLDPASGRALSSVQLSGTVLVTGAAIPNEIRGIDFGPDGKLYGIGFALYTIDPNTGVATRVTPNGRTVAPGITLFGDLDFGPDGQLRAATATLGDTTADLYVINPTTGIGQLVGPMGFRITGLATIAEDAAPPVINTQPLSLTVTAGASASFSVSASGTPPLAYQWRKDGIGIPGETGSTLSVANITPSSTGTYSVVVSNSAGSVTSFPASLALTTGAPGRLVNLSILTTLSRSGDTFTVGTVVGGTATTGAKPVLIRAVGPSLTPLGLIGVLSDPKIDVFSGSNVTATNDNWGGTTNLSTAFAQVGAFAFTGPTSRDAAVYVPSLAPGNYTVQVSGVGGATGTVIAEIYDATVAADFTVATPRLVNVSVLKEVAAGSAMTAGFAVGGSAAMQVLIRAVGPGLTSFGVGNAMVDPTITLYDSGSRPISSNDNWGGTPALISAFSSVGAFALGASSRDAAVLVTLPPGTYTALVNGVGSTGGSVLVEIYELR